MIRSCKF